MKLKSKITDTFWNGLIAGIVIVPAFYFLAEGIREIITIVKEDDYLLRPPITQLLALLFSIILFRIIVVNWKKENLGKGFLFVIMVAVICYFISYFKFRNA